MPSDAVMRLNTRLQDQRVLIRTNDTGAENEEDDTEEGRGMVELIKFPEIVRLASWDDICVRMRVFSSAGS